MNDPNKDYNAILGTLHRMHRQFADLLERLQRGPKKVRAAENRVEELQKLFDVAVKRVVDLRVATDEKQAALDASEKNIQRRSSQLMEAKDNREFQNLKDQVAAEKAACGVLEDEILEAMDRMELLKEESEEVKRELQLGKSQLAKITREIAEEKQFAEEEIRRIKVEFYAEEKNLNGDFLENYKRIFASKQFDTLAPIEGSKCTGCHTKIPLELIARLGQHHPVLCLTCGRMLYLPENFHM